MQHVYLSQFYGGILVNGGVAFRRGTVSYGTRNKGMSHAWMYTSPSPEISGDFGARFLYLPIMS